MTRRRAVVALEPVHTPSLAAASAAAARCVRAAAGVVDRAISRTPRGASATRSDASAGARYGPTRRRR